MLPLGSRGDSSGLTFHEFLQEVPGYTWLVMAVLPLAPLLVVIPGAVLVFGFFRAI